MGRVKPFAARSFYTVVRGLAHVLPAGLLYWILSPYSLARGLGAARKDLRLPISRLPVHTGDRPPGFVARWRFHTAMHQRWLVLFWTDRWSTRGWRSRFTAEGVEVIDRLAAERPIVVVTVHTTPMVVLGAWLMNHGLDVASVIVDPRVWERTSKARAELAKQYAAFGDSAVFMAGDARGMVRFLKRGRCMFLPADHPHGHQVVGHWDGGSLRLSNGAFRIARMTSAAVVPVLVTDAGRWRFRIHVRPAVPDELVASGEEAAAAAHVARELMPIAASRPGEVAETLLAAAAPPQPR